MTTHQTTTNNNRVIGGSDPRQSGRAQGNDAPADQWQMKTIDPALRAFEAAIEMLLTDTSRNPDQLVQPATETTFSDEVECIFCHTINHRNEDCGCDESRRDRLRMKFGADKANAIMEYRCKLSSIESMECKARLNATQLCDRMALRKPVMYLAREMYRNEQCIAARKVEAEEYRVANGILAGEVTQ